jgi:transposase-like protein
MNDYPSKNDVTPDDLMSDFRGKGIAPILIFTVFIHAVLLLGTSVPWLMETFTGGVDKNVAEEERMKDAVREATGSLRDIAEKYGIHPEELSSQFTKGAKPAPAVSKAETPAEPPADAVEPSATPPAIEPQSAIEKELNIEAKGPAVPAIPEPKEEDLFK